MRVTLNGLVSSDEDLELYQYFGFTAFSPQTVRDALAENPEGEELVFEINSPGGSVWAGDEIYTVLRSSEVQTRAEIQSVAASAASYLSLGCSSVWISPVAQMMIHLPTTRTEGDREEHMRTVKLLDSLEESLVNGYYAKGQGKRTREQLHSLLHKSTWMPAQDALDAGLVDGVLFADEDGEYSPAAIVNALGGSVRALTNGLDVPDIAQLRARYRAETQNPAGGPPAENTLDWKAQAALDIERNRFMEVTT